VSREQIDVLLPVRQARRTLPWAVRDVLAQTAVSLRLIAVVDAGPDGEDDGSRRWLLDEAAREPRLSVLDGRGEGAAAALQLALAAGDAPLVSHMEADDRCPPERLAQLVDALDPGLSAVTSRAGQFGARTPGMRRYLDWQNALLDHEQMAAARFVEIPALHQTGLYRRAALEQVGGYRTLGAWPVDIDFWLRWFEHPLRVAKVPRVLYRWRQHPRQSTRSGPGHGLERLRAAKIAGLARSLARDTAARPLLLVSTGRTLMDWEAGLRAAGVPLAGAVSWKPGAAPPRCPDGARLLAVYGMAKARDRLAASLPADVRASTIFAA